MTDAVRASRPSRAWAFPLALVVIVVAIGAVGYLHFDAERRRIVDQQRGALAAVAEAKTSAIVAWTRERRGDAVAVQNAAPLVAWLVRAASSPSVDPANGVSRWLTMMLEGHDYRAAMLVDSGGRIVARAPAETEGLFGFEREFLRRAAAGPAPVFSDLQATSGGAPALLDMAVPLRGAADDAGAAVPVLLLRIEPRRFLAPLVRTWPTEVGSGVSLVVHGQGEGTLLFEAGRDGDAVAPAALSAPADLTAPVAEGFVDGLDYRGVPVLAVVEKIPGTSWSLIARVDRAALEAPIRRTAVQAATVTGGLMAAAALLVGGAWRRRREDERRSREAAAAKSAAVVRHFETLANLVNDIIVLADGGGRILQANDRAVEAYGYTRDELLQLSVEDLRAEPARATLEADLAQVRSGARDRYETIHQRRDGSTFPVEVSARWLEVDDGSFLQGVVRDISERVHLEDELRQSAEKYRALFEGANDGVLLMRGLSFIDCNARAAEMFGCTREEVLASTPVDFSPPFQPDGRRSDEKAEALIAASLRGANQRFEWEHRSRHGSTFFAEVSLSAVEIGGERYVQALMRDVTDRLRTERELRDLNDRLRLLVEGTPHFFFYLQDLEGNTTYVSPTVAAITGRSVAEWTGQHHWFTTGDAINEEAIRRTHDHLRGEFDGRPVVVEIQHADGHPVVLEALETGHYRDGTLVGIQGIAHDVTEQVRARERIELLAHALRSTREGVSVTDAHDVIRFVNAAFCQMYGYQEDEVIGQSVEILRSPRTDHEDAARILPSTLDGGWHGELWNRRKDGTDFPISLSTSIVRDDAGRPLALIGVARDITEQRRTEAAVREALAWQEQIFEGSQDAIFISDEGSRFTAVNHAATRLTGYSRAELLAMSIPDLHDALDRGAYEAFHDRIMDGEDIVSEARLRRKDGSKVEVEFSNTAFDIGGQRFMHTTARDVSERKSAERALKESETRYRTLAETANDLIIVLGLDGRISYCNKRALDVGGYTLDEARALHIAEVIAPSFRAAWEARWQRRGAGDQSRYLYELELVTRDGRTVPVEVSTSPIVEDGVTRAILVVARDISPRIEAERALRASEERYRQLVEMAPETIYVHSGRRVVFINPAGVALFGARRADDVLMRPLWDFLHPDYHAVVEERIRAIEATGEPAPLLEERFVRLDGSEVTAEVGASRTTFGGEPAIQVVARDVTEQAQIRAALRDSEERYRRFFEEDLTGDFITAADGLLLDCNPAFARILGFASVAEAKATSMWEIFPSREQLERLLGQVRERGSLSYHELELRNRAAEPVHTIANLSGVFDRSGALTEIRGYLFDITRHKQVEEQLRHSQKMEALGRVAGGVAHDFNNLLQAMLTTLQLLGMRSGDPAATTAAARELESMVKRGASLSRQLLLFARRSVTKPERIDLNVLVRDASRFLGRLVPDNVRLAIATGPGQLLVEADHGQLEQVLTNLVVNAVDAMPDGGTLTLRTGGADDGEVWMEVEDPGTGIESANLERIFDPFFTTKAPGKGTGLGLAVVHGIVTQHGGRVTVTSRVGVGSTFRVALPRRGPDPSSAAAAPAPAAAGRGERILVVEDSPDVRKLLLRLLARLGYETVPAGSAEEALALGEDQRCSLLLSDVSLPGASGHELAGRLVERWPGLKVILMSGYAEDEVLRHEIATGRYRFLQKPVELDTLAREVRAAFDER